MVEYEGYFYPHTSRDIYAGFLLRTGGVGQGPANILGVLIKFSLSFFALGKSLYTQKCSLTAKNRWGKVANSADAHI